MLTMFPNVLPNLFFKVSTLMIFLMHFAKNIFYFSTMMLPFANDLLIYFFLSLSINKRRYTVTNIHTDKHIFSHFWLLLRIQLHTKKRKRSWHVYNTFHWCNLDLLKQTQEEKNFIEKEISIFDLKVNLFLFDFLSHKWVM